MTKAFQELKTRLGQGVAPQAWAKEYPWITVGAAAVAGFVAASALIPSKEEQALKKLAAIERALNPHPPQPRSADGNGNAPPKESKSMLGTILHEAIAIARPAIVSLMSAHLAGGMPPDGGQPQPGGPDDPNA